VGPAEALRQRQSAFFVCPALSLRSQLLNIGEKIAVFSANPSKTKI